LLSRNNRRESQLLRLEKHAVPRSPESLEGEVMSSQPNSPLVALLLLLGLSVSLALLSCTAVCAQDSAGSSAAQTSDPNLKTYPENEEPNEVPGDNTIRPRPVSPARKQALQRRAGEQVGAVPRGRAVVLGMHIQEADNERAKVVEVAPASPAFDAGIRKGDEIVSFDGFKAATYREWIDGMRRLATDAPDGDSLPVILVRDNKRLNLRVRIPVARAGVPPAAADVTLNQPIVPNQVGQPAVIIPGQQRPFPYGGGIGGDTLIANDLGDDFNSPDGDNAGRAIAEIVRLNMPERPDPVTTTAPGGAAQPRVRDRAIREADNDTGAGPRVGLAGFRNDANGMFVMVDVGGLPPGNYLVGIDDPGILATGDKTSAGIPNQVPIDPRVRTGAGQPIPTPQQPPAPTPAPGIDETPAQLTPPGSQPSPRQRPANPAGSNNSPQSRVEIPRSVLAQVAEPTQATSGAPDSPTASPVQGATPAATPTTEQVQPSTTPTIDDAQTLTPTDPVNTPGAAGLVAEGIGPTLRIGTLTVDQSGTGRLQQVVEAVRVEDVVGQAIVIYAQNANQAATLPPDLDAATDPLAGKDSGVGRPTNTTGAGVTQQGASNSPLGNNPSTSTDSTPSTTEGVTRPATNGVNGFSGVTPVAGGMIRLMSDELPDGTGTATAEQVSPTPQSPNVPQNSAVPTTPGQPTVR
jgi:hypothetical protein